uniref:6-phosphofructokinase n=1 Tax=Rostrostelium ellipticum TaxID=361140 RepID=A0A1L2FUT2_9MYCE|nr:phosphofructokinase [Rostrostelium ellipticum]
MRIAVLTSGGDSSGMNPAIRAFVRAAIIKGAEVFAVREGYTGLVQDSIVKLDWGSVAGILNRGGTVIGTARSTDFRTKEGRKLAALNLIKHKINNLLVIGGDGSLTGANTLRTEWHDILQALLKEGHIEASCISELSTLSIVGIVGSIDNDMCGTDITIGADTACHRILECIDSILSTAVSHQRSFVIEVMGRNCGWLALATGIGSGADYILLPENPPPPGWEDTMIENLERGRISGRRCSMVIVAEGAIDRFGNPISSNYVREVLEKRGYDARITILGHVQRGGVPSFLDRYIVTIISIHTTPTTISILTIPNSNFQFQLPITGYKNGMYVYPSPLSISPSSKFQLSNSNKFQLSNSNSPTLLKFTNSNSQIPISNISFSNPHIPIKLSNSNFQFQLSNSNFHFQPNSTNSNFSIPNPTIPTIPTTPTFQLLTILSSSSSSLLQSIDPNDCYTYQGTQRRGGTFDEFNEIFSICANLNRRHKEPRGYNVAILHSGGPSPGMNPAVRAFTRLGIDAGFRVFGVFNGFAGLANGDIKELTWMTVNGWAVMGGAELGTNRSVPNDTNIDGIVQTLQQNSIDALLMFGGYNGYVGMTNLHTYRAKFPVLERVAMICAPGTIANNVPGTEVSIGADTCLNNILDALDKIKQSAVASRRLFVVEVMGAHCGYLCAMAALASGAERAYTMEEGLSIRKLTDDLRMFIGRFRHNNRIGLVLTSENASPTYSTHYIYDLFHEEGKQLFDARESILGHLQQGGSPSPLDRLNASRCMHFFIRLLETEALEKGNRGIAGCIGSSSGRYKFTPMDQMNREICHKFRRPTFQWWTGLLDLVRHIAVNPEDDTMPHDEGLHINSPTIYSQKSQIDLKTNPQMTL